MKYIYIKPIAQIYKIHLEKSLLISASDGKALTDSEDNIIMEVDEENTFQGDNLWDSEW